MKTLLIALTASCVLASTLRAAEEPESKATVSTPRAVSLGDTDLRSLLRDVGQRVHKKFVWDPRLQLTIDLGSLQRQDVTYPQLLAILQINGYVAVEREGMVEVIPNSDARQAPTPVASPDNIKGLDDELVTVVLTLKNVGAAQLVPILRPLLPQYAHLAAFPDRNALLLTDRSANVRRIVEIARTIDALPKAPADLLPPKTP